MRQQTVIETDSSEGIGPKEGTYNNGSFIDTSGSGPKSKSFKADMKELDDRV